MKAIRLNTTITSVRSRSDDSLGLSLVTATELSPEQMVEIIKLKKIQIDTILNPTQEKVVDMLVIDKDVEHKSPSKRLYNVLYLLWKQYGEEGNYYNDYYLKKIEKIIDHFKSKLD